MKKFLAIAIIVLALIGANVYGYLITVDTIDIDPSVKEITRYNITKADVIIVEYSGLVKNSSLTSGNIALKFFDQHNTLDTSSIVLQIQFENDGDISAGSPKHSVSLTTVGRWVDNDTIKIEFMDNGSIVLYIDEEPRITINDEYPVELVVVPYPIGTSVYTSGSIKVEFYDNYDPAASTNQLIILLIPSIATIAILGVMLGFFKKMVKAIGDIMK